MKSVSPANRLIVKVKDLRGSPGSPGMLNGVKLKSRSESSSIRASSVESSLQTGISSSVVSVEVSSDSSAPSELPPFVRGVSPSVKVSLLVDGVTPLSIDEEAPLSVDGVVVSVDGVVVSVGWVVSVSSSVGGVWLSPDRIDPVPTSLVSLLSFSLVSLSVGWVVSSLHAV
jgi:hypothetical protein